MISLEGLTLTTGRQLEAGYILRTLRPLRARRPHPQLLPRGRPRGRLPHRRRHPLVLPRSRPLPGGHRRHASPSTSSCPCSSTSSITICAAPVSASASIPQDGLLRQGAEGYQLTWMDAKVDGWVVTPRRGKAVEINALWYNALRLLERWVRDRQPDEAAVAAANALAGHAEKARDSFNHRFWYAEGGYLYDVVDGVGRTSRVTIPPAVRTRSSPSRSPIPSSTASAGSRSCDIVRDQLLTPVGLRSLAPGHPDLQGALRRRSAGARRRLPSGHRLGLAHRPVHRRLAARPSGRQARRPRAAARLPRHTSATPVSARSAKSSTPRSPARREAAWRRRGAWRRCCGAG